MHHLVLRLVDVLVVLAVRLLELLGPETGIDGLPQLLILVVLGPHKASGIILKK